MSMKIILLVAICGVICVQAGPLKNFEELRELLSSMEGHEQVKRQPGGGQGSNNQQNNNGGGLSSAIEDLKDDMKEVKKLLKDVREGVEFLVDQYLGKSESSDGDSESSGSEESGSEESGSEESGSEESDSEETSEETEETESSDEGKRALTASMKDRKSKLTIEKLELIRKIVDNLELASSTV